MVATLVVALLVGCGGRADGEKKILVVLAAASLTQVFGELEREFEAAHPGVEVQMSFGGSSDLVTQIAGGAPVDVFASADVATMDRLGDRAVERSEFAANSLQIVVPAGNPAGIETVDDLADDDVTLVICAREVPCGSATQRLAIATGVELSPVSEEQSVTDVLGKVASGEAEAGLVYVTDVAAAGGEVEGIVVPEAAQVANTYPIAVVDGAEQEQLAREFLELVLGETGQRVLRDARFERP